MDEPEEILVEEEAVVAVPVDRLKDVPLKGGEARVVIGGQTFITRPEDVVVSVEQWCMSAMATEGADLTLLGAFEQVMRARGFLAAKPADVQAAYDAFKNEKV